MKEEYDPWTFPVSSQLENEGDSQWLLIYALVPLYLLHPGHPSMGWHNLYSSGHGIEDQEEEEGFIFTFIHPSWVWIDDSLDKDEYLSMTVSVSLSRSTICPWVLVIFIWPNNLSMTVSQSLSLPLIFAWVDVIFIFIHPQKSFHGLVVSLYSSHPTIFFSWADVIFIFVPPSNRSMGWRYLHLHPAQQSFHGLTLSLSLSRPTIFMGWRYLYPA